MMAFFILSPVALLALVQGFWPELGLYQAVPFPATAVVAMALVALVAGLMRQTDWLYWLALLAGHYWAAQTGLQRPVAELEVAALYQVLPLAMTLFMLVLTLVPLPRVLTFPGTVLIALCLLWPVVFLYFPLSDALAAIGMPELLTRRPVPGVFLSWVHWWWLSGLLFLWLALVNYRGHLPTIWGQFSVWLSLMLFYALLDRDNASGWMTLAASTGLLITLAYRMVHLAYIDELTQLPQRRALEHRLQRLGREAAVSMLDVDHFKAFNDTWGHEVGDQVLRLLGSILSRQKGLEAFRYGGEEFTLVFSHANKKVVAEALERVRSDVEAYPLRLRDNTRPDNSKAGKTMRGDGGGEKVVHITISLGAALRKPGEDSDALLKRSDEALYKAKKGGRNCWKVV